MASLAVNHKFEQSPITPEVLQKTVSKIGAKIPDDLVEDYTAALADSQKAIEALMAMDGILFINY